MTLTFSASVRPANYFDEIPSDLEARWNSDRSLKEFEKKFWTFGITIWNLNVKIKLKSESEIQSNSDESADLNRCNSDWNDRVKINNSD